MTATTKEAYALYHKSGGTLDYTTFREICCLFNTKAMDQIIEEGRLLDMGSNLSTLQVVRRNRNFRHPTVNWKLSNARREEILQAGGTPYSKETPEGEKWFIYYTDDYYCAFYWRKKFCRVQNRSAYRFQATGLRNNTDPKGNIPRLKKRLQEVPLAYLTYDLHDPASRKH